MPNTYVMSDIHGCYDDFIKMLGKIQFSSNDRLIIAGDYLDRGIQNYEMLQWIEHQPDNVILLKGNHDVEFVYCVDLMETMFSRKELPLDDHGITELIYDYLCKMKDDNSAYVYFDYYGTIGKLIKEHNVNMNLLKKWKNVIREMPLVHKEKIAGKKYIIVHAGYVEDVISIDTEYIYETTEDFYLNARDDAYMCGGVSGGVIVAGHTPTIFEDELPYNNGNIYMFYDEELDCKFYDIDCGCAYKAKYSSAKLACIRLEDERLFYV